MKQFEPSDLDQHDMDRLTSEIAGSSPEGWSDDTLRRVIVAGANLLFAERNSHPRRMFSAEIHAGADSRARLVEDLRSIAESIESGEDGPVVSGSGDAGCLWSVIVNPEMTNEAYFKAIGITDTEATNA